MIKDNKQITTLNQLTQLSLSSYPFTKQSQQKQAHNQEFFRAGEFS